MWLVYVRLTIGTSNTPPSSVYLRLSRRMITINPAPACPHVTLGVCFPCMAHTLRRVVSVRHRTTNCSVVIFIRCRMSKSRLNVRLHGYTVVSLWLHSSHGHTRMCSIVDSNIGSIGTASANSIVRPDLWRWGAVNPAWLCGIEATITIGIIT